MSRTMLRPATAPKSSPVGNGKRAEEKFIQACLDHEISANNSDHDNGIDFVTWANDPVTGKCVYKKIQVTKGSWQNQSKNGYCVTKKLSQLREDIQIVAILIEHDSGDTKNINTGKAGNQDIWLFVPIDVYCHPRMYQHYVNTTRTWYLNVEKKLSPPLDAAHDAWYLFSRECLEEETAAFFLGKAQNSKSS
jgi:hypothetical protein